MAADDALLSSLKNVRELEGVDITWDASREIVGDSGEQARRSAMALSRGDRQSAEPQFE
ncbi:MAG TPA: hypothetical protein VF424_01100 [Vicinamibacterales bacterium]